MLKITNPNQVSVLNRWAAGVDKQISDLQSNLRAVSTTVDNTVATTNTSTTTTVTPVLPNPTNVQVSESGIVIGSTTWSSVAFAYEAPYPLEDFAGIYVVVAGYAGNSALVKIGQNAYKGIGGGYTDFQLMLQQTSETVTFYFVPQDDLGATPDSSVWASCPHVTCVLDGVASTPNTPVGVSAQASSSNVAVIWIENAEKNIAHYNVYRNSTFDPSSSSVIGTATPSGTGAISFVDSGASNSGTVYYYWITAVNTSSQESAKSAVAVSYGAPTNSYNIFYDSIEQVPLWEDVVYGGDGVPFTNTYTLIPLSKVPTTQNFVLCAKFNFRQHLSFVWAAQNLAKNDGTTLAIPSGMYDFGALAAGGPYFLYFYLDPTGPALAWSNATPPPTSPNLTDAVQESTGSRIPLPPLGLTLVLNDTPPPPSTPTHGFNDN